LEKISDNTDTFQLNLNEIEDLLKVKDFHIFRHQKLEKLCLKLGECFNFSDTDLFLMRIVAKYHDLGKIMIPDEVLFKKGKLTDAEIAEIKLHPQTGARIARYFTELWPIFPYILFHHEQWNGCGYPHGLSKYNIPIFNRILSVVDAYDAMTTKRPYRNFALTHDEALQEIYANSGTQFDPAITRIFTHSEFWK
jgi:HD-GYP domain-containing protein (c-di-GMP phosphodiesterase class II)